MQAEVTPEVSAPESVSAAPETTTPQNAAPTPDGQEGVEVGNAVPPSPFKPNYKVKVMDEEKEIDPLFHPLMTDAEKEKKIREIFERSYGHEYLKPKYEKIKEEFGSLQSQFQEQSKFIQWANGLSNMLRNGDFGSYIENARIPKELVFKWVHNEVKKLQMDPTQRAELERQEQLQREYTSQSSVIEQQKQMLENMQRQYEQVQLQTRQNEMNQVLSRPEVKSVVDAFDKRMGTPGAFMQAVIQTGRQAWNNGQGQDLSAEQAVQHVKDYALRLMGGLTQEMETPQAAMVDATTGATVAQPTKQATLPHIAGRGTSPVRKAPKSLDDLRKLANEL